MVLVSLISNFFSSKISHANNWMRKKDTYLLQLYLGLFFLSCLLNYFSTYVSVSLSLCFQYLNFSSNRDIELLCLVTYFTPNRLRKKVNLLIFKGREIIFVAKYLLCRRPWSDFHNKMSLTKKVRKYFLPWNVGNVPYVF